MKYRMEGTDLRRQGNEAILKTIGSENRKEGVDVTRLSSRILQLNN